MRPISAILSVYALFILKLFTKQLPLTIFYSKLIVKIPLTVICVINPESIVHIFCECDFVRPIWEELFKIIKDKYGTDFTNLNFDKIFLEFLETSS